MCLQCRCGVRKWLCVCSVGVVFGSGCVFTVLVLCLGVAVCLQCRYCVREWLSVYSVGVVFGSGCVFTVKV